MFEQENDYCLIDNIRKMKKILPFLVVLLLIVSCEKELAKAPKNLIAKEKMVNIMYDLSLLEALKNQNPSETDSLIINSNEYIFRKYKIDSIQFAQSNIYYATDYKEYLKMFEQIKARLDKNKSQTEALIKAEKKKEALVKKKLKKSKNLKENDSVKKAKQNSKIKKETDSINKTKKKR